MGFSSKPLLNSGCALFLLATTPFAIHAEGATAKSFKSISYINYLETSEAYHKAELDHAAVEILEPLVTEGFRLESLPAAVVVESTVYYYDGDISIYDASSSLISDFDNDGFYHRFSVAIDADSIYSESWVYAKLYLSYEGGPWNYYATSTDFHIYGDSELDAFVIETELAEGFPPGYYDVRIELYDAEYGDYLLSYGPYDDASLSALPLEDSVFDDASSSVTYSTTEVIVAGHGHGGLGGLFLVALGLAVLLRRFARA
jgi:hypothetical protein